MKNHFTKLLCAQTIILSMVVSLCGCGSKAPTANVDQAATTTDVEVASDALLAGATTSITSSFTHDIENKKIDKSTAKAYAYEEEGVTLYLPPEYLDTKGVISYSATDLTSGDGLFLIQAQYCGMSKDDIDKLMNDENATDEDFNKYSNSLLTLFDIVGINKNRNAQDIVDIVNQNLHDAGMEDSDIKASDLIEVATYDDCTYYKTILPDDDNYYTLDPEFQQEYDILVSYADSIAEEADYYKALGIFPGVVGSKISFETTDIYGNPVKSEDLFAQHDITMVNVWATWCGWCIKELPELEEINKRLAKKNCAIVGLLGDGTTNELIEEGKALLKDSGCTYTNLLPYDGWQSDFDMSEGWPTSFLVDSTGTIVAIPIIGAELKKYEGLIEKALNGTADSDYNDVTSNSAENAEGAYRIFVVDEESNPVEGAVIQFCSGNTCNMAETDKDGIATFEKPEDVYEVHVLKAPKGYKPDDDKYVTTKTYSDLTIVLEKD